MAIEREQDVTPAVLTVMDRTSDPRLREIMRSLVKHLHGFVREVRLTETEFRDAAAIINALGQGSDDNHNETILMAGSLGVSSLVCLLNNGDKGNTETSQSLLGPFWRLELAADGEWRLDRPFANAGSSALRHRTRTGSARARRWPTQRSMCGMRLPSAFMKIRIRSRRR